MRVEEAISIIRKFNELVKQKKAEGKIDMFQADLRIKKWYDYEVNLVKILQLVYWDKEYHKDHWCHLGDDFDKYLNELKEL